MRKFILIIFTVCVSILWGFDNSEPNIEADIEKVDLQLNDNEIGITFINLTSGESTLIQHGNGKNILINNGGPNTEKELKKVLNMFHVQQIDMLIVTSDDDQYMSNTEFLKENYTIKKFVTGEQILLKSQLKQKLNVVKWEVWTTNDKIELLPELFVYVLHDYDEDRKPIGLDFKLQFHDTAILYMTSSDKQVEQQLMKKHLQDVNILKVAHFGDERGSSKPFIDHVDPQVAIIFRKKNEWPSPAVIERLYQTWIDIYPTKQFGNISIKLDEKSYEVIPISSESTNIDPS